VPHDDPLFLVALAAFMRRYRARATGISGQLAGHEVKVGEEFVVVRWAPKGRTSTTT
jgi:propionyl-CoA carboxylase alpha chain